MHDYYLITCFRLSLRRPNTTLTTTKIPASIAYPTTAGRPRNVEAGGDAETTVNDITLKGRDLFGYMRLVPGVIVDRTQTRDVTDPNNIRGISIQYDTDESEDMLEFTNDNNELTTLHFESRVDGDS